LSICRIVFTKIWHNDIIMLLFFVRREGKQIGLLQKTHIIAEYNRKELEM